MNLNINKQKRRFLLVLPVLVTPFLCLVFFVLGGGQAEVKAGTKAISGLNTQLPASPFDPAKAFQDKLKAYQRAESDSARKAQYQRQDPYHNNLAVIPVKPATAAPPQDPRAEQLLAQLGRLQNALHQKPMARPAPLVGAPRLREPEPDDPQIDRLDGLLDKVIRIQHPQEKAAAATPPVRVADAVLPADSTANSIAAIIPEDQVLTAGATIALRIVDPIRVSGRLLPAGQLVYGAVTLNNDRLLVHIGSLREDRNLYPTDWQVYDLDGLAGIHIPGLVGRDVAKESADEGVSSLNVLPLDPNVGVQVAGAGIQAAKTFLRRKVRQVRVTVRAGYQVLLRNPRAAEATHASAGSVVVRRDSVPPPPDGVPDGPVLVRCRNEGVELRLRSLCVQDSCLWFGLEWENHSPIVFTPAYARWVVRDRRVFRRTALQEQGLEPLVAALPATVGRDSVQYSFTGFRPFALSKGKELVLEVGEKGGGRTLVLTIDHSQILKASSDAKVSQK